MKALVQDRYGSPDVLRFADVDQPEPGEDEVSVRVHAAAVNAYDWHVLRGDPYIARLSGPFGWRGPKARIRGRDFAGRVEAVGPAVTRLRPGDEVYGEANGAFAEHLCVPERLVERKPANLTFEQAAAMPLAANTALIGIRDVARVEPGQRVLINGAAGGVGTFAVQLAVSYGAEVTGVCGTANVGLVRSLGAADVVDHSQADFARSGRRYDVLLDLVGNRSLRDLRGAVTPTGTVVLSGGGLSRGGSLFGPLGLLLRAQAVSRFVGQRLVLLTAGASRENLAALRELAESGRLTPVIDRRYPLSAAADAVRYVETGHARGKVIVTV